MLGVLPSLSGVGPCRSKPMPSVVTAEAASVLANAERVEKEVLAFERRLAGREAQLEGTLRLSATDWFGTLLLAPALAEFGRQHPSVAFELLTDARHYSLSRREADMVFRSRRFDEPEVVARRLMHIPFALYGVPGSDKTVLGDGTGARMVTMDAIVPDLPDATWRRQYLPKSVVPANATIACCRPAFVRSAPASPCFLVLWETLPPMSSRWRPMTRHPGGTSSSATIAICVD